ncbi:MAG TPA: S24 family peptidase [Fimbriimonas sp.]|nr:S24 family peptidase [Fimbriimonas sp.]
MAKAAGMSVEYLASGSPSLVEEDQFATAKRVKAQTGKSWEPGTTLAYFHRELVKEKFKGANPENLLLVEAEDPYMQPRIWQNEMVVVDGSKTKPKNGIFALMIDGEILVRHIAKLKDGFVVHDRRKRRGQLAYSLAEFEQDVSVIGKAVISGHYPEITEDNFD